MRSQDKEVRGVAWMVTEGVLEQVQPEALAFPRETIEKVADSPLAGIDLGEGKKELLRRAAAILSSIREAIRQAIKAIVQKGPGEIRRPEDVAEMVKQYLRAQRMSGELGTDVSAALDSFFKQHPSSIDQIFGLSLAPPAPVCDPLVILSSALLKVVDPQGGVSSGFAISDEGYVLTAAHVVGRHNEVSIAFRYRTPGGNPQEESVQATVVHRDTEEDISILHCSKPEWDRLTNLGVRVPPLGLDWRPSSWVLCLGYQEQQIFADPVTVEAFIKRWDPVRAVRFRDDRVQDCLVLVIPLHAPAIVPGMSGAPVMDLETCRVIGMVTGATREAWVRQRWLGEEIWELIAGRYGFAIPLTKVRESWPLFQECCLVETKPKEVR